MDTNIDEIKKVGKYVVGKVYRYADTYGGIKYYLQREDDVLMVNASIDLINVHEKEKLTHNEESFGEVFKEVPIEEFKEIIRGCIFNLGIYEFVKGE